MRGAEIVASEIVFALADLLAEHAESGRPVPPSLATELSAGLFDLAEHVLALEAVARSAGLLGQREFVAAVTSLPIADRRALAREALRRAEGKVVPLPGRGERAVAAEYVDLSGGDAA